MSAPASRTKPGDLTAKQRAESAAKSAEELSRRKDEITLINQVATERLDNSVLDAKGHELSDVEIAEVVISPDRVHEIIRVSQDVNFVLGADRYELVAGQKYKVPKHVADHLEEVGYLWRMS